MPRRATRPLPLPSNTYGSPDEETNRVFRRYQGTLPGTRIGLPGHYDSPQSRDGKWHPGPLKDRARG